MLIYCPFCKPAVWVVIVNEVILPGANIPPTGESVSHEELFSCAVCHCRSAEPGLVIFTTCASSLIMFTSFVLNCMPGHTPKRQGFVTRPSPRTLPDTSSSTSNTSPTTRLRFPFCGGRSFDPGGFHSLFACVNSPVITVVRPSFRFSASGCNALVSGGVADWVNIAAPVRSFTCPAARDAHLYC